MFRERCRPKYSDEELKEIYANPWGFQDDWKDHVLRRNATLVLAARFIDDSDRVAADLSCGDGYFATHLPSLSWLLGDYAPGYPYTGPLEETIHQLADDHGEVDVYFCCETIEHLDDPDQVLKYIRRYSKKLVLSTPICRWWDENPEHYWSWDQKAVKKMLIDTGWNPVEYEETYCEPGYSFQIWGCIRG